MAMMYNCNELNGGEDGMYKSDSELHVGVLSEWTWNLNWNKIIFVVVNENSRQHNILSDIFYFSSITCMPLG